MTTYMLADSPESAGSIQQPMGMDGGSQHHSSNAPSMIGSPRSTPVFGGNGHLLKVYNLI